VTAPQKPITAPVAKRATELRKAGMSFRQIRQELEVPQSESTLRVAILSYAEAFGVTLPNQRPAPKTDAHWQMIQAAIQAREAGATWFETVTIVGWQPHDKNIARSRRRLQLAVQRYCARTGTPFPGGRKKHGPTRFDSTRDERLRVAREVHALHEQGIKWADAVSIAGWKSSIQAAIAMTRRWEGRL